MLIVYRVSASIEYIDSKMYSVQVQIRTLRKKLPMNPDVTFPMPDDWHVHLRDESMLRKVIDFSTLTSRQMLLMPNLVPPLTTAKMVMDYLTRVERAKFESRVTSSREFYGTLYLHKDTTAADIQMCAEQGMILAAKFYPDGGTTNSASQLKSPRDLNLDVLDAMSLFGMTLCLHGEVTADVQSNPLLREYDFIKHLDWLVELFPDLKIMVEHVSDRRMARRVLEMPSNVAMTITAHHPFISHSDAVRDVHCSCMPIAKSARDRDYLAWLILQADVLPKVIYGSDTAPHPLADKLEGKAGVWSAPVALSVLWNHFDKRGGYTNWEAFRAFTSENGSRFYGPGLGDSNRGTITLVREAWKVPENVAGIVPWMAGEVLEWRVKGMEWFGEVYED